MILPEHSLDEILSFWFEEAGRSKWFAPDDAFDAQIRRRFEMISVSLAGVPFTPPKTPKVGLAIILCLDQFSRNMYRGTSAAFAWDEKAILYSEYMIERGWDIKLEQSKRAFIYMPYMHSEDIEMQEKSVRLIDQNLDDDNTLFHARAHLKLIKQFGRFPHRNETVGRPSTPEELAYLADGGYQP